MKYATRTRQLATARERRRYERRKAGLRVYAVELDEADTETLLESFGELGDPAEGIERVFAFLIELDAILTRGNTRVANLLRFVSESIRRADEGQGQ